MVHNLRDFSSFAEETAPAKVKDFDKAIHDAILVPDVCDMLYRPVSSAD